MQQLARSCCMRFNAFQAQSILRGVKSPAGVAGFSVDFLGARHPGTAGLSGRVRLSKGKLVVV